MDILAQTYADLPEDEGGGSRGYPLQQYPIPNGCSRFILPTELRRTLHDHPLGGDLHTRAAGHYSRDPGHDPFMQPCHVVYYCIRGKMRLRSAAADRLLSPGDIAINPPGTSALAAASDETLLSFYWVAFSGNLSAAYTQFIDLSDNVVSVGLHPELIAQFESLCGLHDLQLASFNVDRFINGANLLKVLLTSIPVLVSRKTNGKKNRIDLGRIRGLMAQRLCDPLRLEEIARASNLSPYHFARTFKRRTGLAPMQYFTRMRLQQACRLLDTTALTIKQISVTVGYPDPQYFSRSFRKTFGVAPHAYRNRTTRAGPETANVLPDPVMEGARQ